ncbi:DivIVA domain-containing protein [Aeromicrobium sp. UC242_57]|uniref:DivIVA domain-containing protein n=1 Tax=Aeromicrobium sp. UC242_57 TaxID=3374624 RepID=UPI00378CCB8B
MPLTPEDVRNKRFTPVRLREGYDMGEVDQFLDEVEAELERLTVENEELRAKVAAASTGEPTGLIPALSSSTPAQQTPPAPAVQEPVKAVVPTPAPEPTPEPEPTQAPVVAAAPAPERPRPTMGDASSAAARLLEIASNNAEPADGRGEGRSRSHRRRGEGQG